MLAGKFALVTGSTSGIGLEVLRSLAGAGAQVAMHGLGDATQVSVRECVLLYSNKNGAQPCHVHRSVCLGPSLRPAVND